MIRLLLATTIREQVEAFWGAAIGALLTINTIYLVRVVRNQVEAFSLSSIDLLLTLFLGFVGYYVRFEHFVETQHRNVSFVCKHCLPVHGRALGAFSDL